MYFYLVFWNSRVSLMKWIGFAWRHMLCFSFEWCVLFWFDFLLSFDSIMKFLCQWRRRWWNWKAFEAIKQLQLTLMGNDPRELVGLLIKVRSVSGLKMITQGLQFSPDYLEHFIKDQFGMFWWLIEKMKMFTTLMIWVQAWMHLTMISWYVEDYYDDGLMYVQWW